MPAPEGSRILRRTPVGPRAAPLSRYVCKHEMACTVKDMLTLRMRLAYVNSEAAKSAIPRVADLMATHLKWSKSEKKKQIRDAEDYVGQFGGPVANKKSATLRQATYTDLHEVFVMLDTDGACRLLLLVHSPLAAILPTSIAA